MSLPFAIEQRLSRRHLAQFRDLMLERSFTIEIAMAWLQERGCRVSHGAVGNYLASRRAPDAVLRRRIATLGTDKDTRRQLAAWALHLEGVGLSQLALTAFYLLSKQAAQRGIRLDEIPGAVPKVSRGHRRPI